MTENEARLWMRRSPSETTYKLVLHCGLPVARQLAKKWLAVLVNLKRAPVSSIEFWASVLSRLSGYRPLEGQVLYLTNVSTFERRHYDLMLSRVGLQKGGHSNGSPKPALNKPAPMTSAEHVSI